MFDQMKNQARAYFTEAKWLDEERIPTTEEYMDVALVSAGYIALATTSLVGMGDIATIEAFDWLSKGPKIMSSSNFIARVMDDIKSHKVCTICDSNGENNIRVSLVPVFENCSIFENTTNTKKMFSENSYLFFKFSVFYVFFLKFF